MTRKSTIKLLLINESDNEGERLISLFRNAGRVARAHRASSAEDLHKNLETQSWDLLIANDKHPEIAIDQCLEQLNKTSANIPVIVIRDEDAQSALDAGADDVVASQDDQRLVHAAFRALRCLEQRRELQLLQEKLADAEQRSAQLMDQSQDSIAYVSDGMLVNSNKLFCQRFGYDNLEDLDCAPIIDLIANDNHGQFKELLKSQLTSGEGSTDFNFTGLMQAGDSFSATMQLSNAVFDDEDCIQLSIRDQATPASSSAVSQDIDPATGLYSYDYFRSQLESYTKQSASGAKPCALLFIGIDKFTSFRSRFGIIHNRNVVLDIAHFIQQQTTDNSWLSQVCDDSFTLLLPDTSAAQAETYAKELCKSLEQHIIEIDGQSTQCTASIGIVILDGQIQEPADKLIDHAFNSCEQLRQQANNDGAGNDAAIYVPTRVRKSLGDASDDKDLDSFLEEALEDGQFTLTFQPIVSLRGTSGDHYEVQTKMANADGEYIHADDFLGSLQFKQVNTRLDRWIIIEATKQLATRLETYKDTCLLINLTPNALQDESLIPWLNVALKAGGIPAAALTFQFRESDISHCLKPAKVFASAVKSIGCRISITGFGQIDDPVKALKHVQADFAKIDSKFTSDLQNTGDNQIVKALVSSINENEAQTIISGVANAAALAMLWQLGVDYIQGDYMAAASAQMDYEFTDIA
jgi:multidomain signaling protein FimX